MKCHYHPDLDSVNICSTCSRSLCPSCANNIKGRILCRDCLVAGAEFAAIATNPRFANYSPGRAALFAVIPGIGAVYNQQYVKAVQHFAVFAALIMIADRGQEIFGFAAFAFYVFTIIDAYRSAQSIVRRAVSHPGEVQHKSEVNVPIWGAVLVALGILFFLDNINALRLDRLLDEAWPLLFVAAGFYLIIDFYRRGQTEPSRATAGSSASPYGGPPPASSVGSPTPPPQPASGAVSLPQEEKPTQPDPGADDQSTPGQGTNIE